VALQDAAGQHRACYACCYYVAALLLLHWHSTHICFAIASPGCPRHAAVIAPAVALVAWFCCRACTSTQQRKFIKALVCCVVGPQLLLLLLLSKRWLRCYLIACHSSGTLLVELAAAAGIEQSTTPAHHGQTHSSAAEAAAVGAAQAWRRNQLCSIILWHRRVVIRRWNTHIVLEDKHLVGGKTNRQISEKKRNR
jgi:hypothetical protein